MFWIYIIILITILILIAFLNWLLPNGTLSKSFKHLFTFSSNNDEQELEQPHNTDQLLIKMNDNPPLL
jgi:uncharacterized ion transporter superfamily protein YfcC